MTRTFDWLRNFRTGLVTRRRLVRSSDRRRISRMPRRVEALETRVVLVADFGDAPDTGVGTDAGNYSTTEADGGPSHEVVVGLRLGATVDGDDGTLQNARAHADDVDGALPDDEDGVLSPFTDLIGTVGAVPTVTLLVTNTNNSEDAATLAGWIDFNNDGNFDNATERATATVPFGTTNGRVTLTFPAVPIGFTGTTYARFRLSTDAVGLNSTGADAAAEHEIELEVVKHTEAKKGFVLLPRR